MTTHCNFENSVFEQITASTDYLGRKCKRELPKINLSTQEVGREVNMIEAKIAKNSTTLMRKTGLSSASKKSDTPTKTKSTLSTTPISEKKTTFPKQLNFKLRVAPPTTLKVTKDDCNRKGNNYKSSNGGHRFVSDVNCTYEIKDRNSDEKEGPSYKESSKQDNASSSQRKKLDDCATKNAHNIAVNLNLALNMDSKKKDQLDEKMTELNSNEMNRDNMQINEEMKEKNLKTKSSVTVAVRMRPLSDHEKTLQGETITDIKIKDDMVMIPQKRDCFKFDYCLNSSNQELFSYGSQEAVFRKMGEPLLDLALEGYNTCLFAYGQSGSGKTYTMLGSELNPGIIPRFINELFRRINCSRDIEFIVNISFFEIYNEKIHDLLADEFSICSKNLRVREDPETGPYIQDLTVYTVENYKYAMELLYNGVARRSTASTQSNEHSSRSHSIFNLIIVQNKRLDILDPNGGTSETSCISKINLVDLAGSERASSSANNDRIREGNSINRSLLTLGKVITLLAESNGNNKRSHIPYRDSVLTYLLKDSLGGNSRTSMIATISPSKLHIDETISTLRYASSAQKIVNTVHVNEDPKLKIIDMLRKQVSFLKKEVVRTKSDSLCSENSDNERETTDKQWSVCCENFLKDVRKMNEKIEQLVEGQKQIAENFKQLKDETNQNFADDEKVEFSLDNSKLVDQMRSMLKEIKEEDLFKDAIDYESVMQEMTTNDDEFDSDSEYQSISDKKIKDKSKGKQQKDVKVDIGKRTNFKNKQLPEPEKQRRMSKLDEDDDYPTLGATSSIENLPKIESNSEMKNDEASAKEIEQWCDPPEEAGSKSKKNDENLHNAPAEVVKDSNENQEKENSIEFAWNCKDETNKQKKKRLQEEKKKLDEDKRKEEQIKKDEMEKKRKEEAEKKQKEEAEKKQKEKAESSEPVADESYNEYEDAQDKLDSKTTGDDEKQSEKPSNESDGQANKNSKNKREEEEEEKEQEEKEDYVNSDDDICSGGKKKMNKKARRKELKKTKTEEEDAEEKNVQKSDDDYKKDENKKETEKGRNAGKKGKGKKGR